VKSLRFSNGLRVAVFALVFGSAITAGSPASALTITGTFSGVGAVPAGTTGTGTLQGLFNYAASQWEALILDVHTLTITYDWGPLGGTTIGLHVLGTQGGVPNRETSATLTFDNSERDDFWFLDGTPGNNSEYTTNTQSSADLGGGLMTTGNQWTGATGDAQNRTDLLSVVIHEIGHALGLSASNLSFQGEAGVDADVDVTSGIFNGAVIPMNATNNAHVQIGTALMFPTTANETRTLISQADLMANCQISQFTDCLNGRVPEPSSLLLLGAGLASLAGWRWRRRA
jgi:hypothetical protein